MDAMATVNWPCWQSQKLFEEISRRSSKADVESSNDARGWIEGTGKLEIPKGCNEWRLKRRLLQCFEANAPKVSMPLYCSCQVWPCGERTADP